MLQLGEKVVIVADRFEQQLPIGEYGYIIAYDRNADNAFDYVIRVPKANRNFFVPASDIECEEREALIDYALATRNEELFRRLMSNNEELEAEQEEDAEPMTAEDFIRKVNLRAWI